MLFWEKETCGKQVFFYIFLLLTLPSLTGKGQHTEVWQSVKAMESDVAADAVGVNTHLNYSGSVYDTHYNDLIKPRLRELGTRHIRDHFGDDKINERYVDLAHHFGIKLLLINNDAGEDLKKTRDEAVRLNSIDANKPVIELIEPANERDIGWNYDWAKLCAYMQRYYDTYKAHEVTRIIPLLGPSFANTRNSAVDFAKACPATGAVIEAGNLHAYSGLFPESPMAGGWGISFEQALKSYALLCPGRPVIETESGYKMSEGASGHPAVSQRTAAKYSPRIVLERIRSGVNRLYFYQLINNAEDFGLLNEDGSPRLAYTSLKNFIQLMSDKGTGFKPSSLSYSLGKDVKDIHQMLFQKRDGRFFLILWQGVNGSAGGTNNNYYSDLKPAEKKIRLSLSRTPKSINIYRPSFETLPDGNGIKPVLSVSGKSGIDFSVPDHIVVAEISY